MGSKQFPKLVELSVARYLDMLFMKTRDRKGAFSPFPHGCTCISQYAEY